MKLDFIVSVHTPRSHTVGHPRCVFISYIWLNQLSNTTNLLWIDVYYLVINYMFRRFGHLQVDELTKNTHKQLHLACVLYTEDGGTRSHVYWAGRGVYMGAYYANLSFVEFRTMIQL